MGSYHYMVPPPPESPYYADAVTGHPIDVQHGDLWRRTDIEEFDIEADREEW